MCKCVCVCERDKSHRLAENEIEHVLVGGRGLGGH